jgi:hypothetical protein
LGEEFFKQIGAKLGVFLDYDESTTSMRRLDVARLRIQSDIWAIIDGVIKVEVEGVVFNVRVMEERGLEWPVADLDEGLVEGNSVVVPSEASGAAEEELGGAGGNSGDDEASEPEHDVDVTMQIQYGGNLEEVRVYPTCAEELVKRNDSLVEAKSTKIPDSKEVSESFVAAEVGSEALVKGQVEKGSDSVGPIQGVELNTCDEGGPKPIEERDGVDDVMGWTGPFSDPVSNPSFEPLLLAHCQVGLLPQDFGFRGPVVREHESRLSSISEPEEVLLSSRTNNQNRPSKRNKSKSAIKPQLLGAPKCVKLMEAVL